MSWCHLGIVQAGTLGSWVQEPGQRAVVVLSRSPDNPGTRIAQGIEFLVTLVTDMFRLEPCNTIYIEHNGAVESDEESYERIQFVGCVESSDLEEPRYLFYGPCWERITLREVARLIQRLDRRLSEPEL